MGITYDELVTLIHEEKGVAVDEIHTKVKEKIDRLSGLVSKEGACHIVANELGLNLVEGLKRKGIKIDKLAPGMRAMSVVGKVTKVDGIRTFMREGKERRVGNFAFGDETGTIRVVVWDEKIMDAVNQIQEGMIVRLMNGFVKENGLGKEIHLSTSAQIQLQPAGYAIGDVKSTIAMPNAKKLIAQLSENDGGVLIEGTVVEVFPPRTFVACNECFHKVGDDGTCSTHATAGTQTTASVNFILDDGSDTIKASAFRESALKLLAMNVDEIASFSEANRQQVLGKQVKVSGRAKKNDYSGMLEFSARQIEEIQPSTLTPN